MNKILLNHYGFTFNSAYDEDASSPYPTQTHINKSIEIDADSPWPVILKEFANFLSGIYGYDVTEKVFVKTFAFEDGDEMVSLNDYT